MPPRLRPRSLSLASADSKLYNVSTSPITRRAAFSTTHPRGQLTRQRREMFEWYKDKASSFEKPIGKPNYLGPSKNQVFPLNPLFKSQSVLSEDARELIWQRCVVEGKPLKVVSADLGVDIRRVAAVIRMKEMEKQWTTEGKPLARAYAAAIMSMLPQTDYNKTEEAEEDDKDPKAWRERREPKKIQHEPINDVTVHPYSMQQLFVPTAESHEFTRADAAKAFHETLKPADERVPLPELIQLEKLKLAGVPEQDAVAAYELDMVEQEHEAAERAERRAAQEEAKISRVQSGRYEFRFKDVNADVVGGQGRHPDGVGWRYGAPLQDRKRGLSKIPKQFP